MRITSAVVIVHLILLVSGNDLPRGPKRVTCYYMGVSVGPNSTLLPEDIDASICTHLVYIHGAINVAAEKIYLDEMAPDLKTGGEGFLPRLVKLKGVNPDMKLILHVADPDYSEITQEPSMRSNIIQSGIKWLNASGFDGLELPIYRSPDNKEEIAEFFCEMKNEFDKHGYILTSIFMENSFPDNNQEIVNKMARCCDQVSLRTTNYSERTHRLAPLSQMKSNVDNYIERGLPADKALIIVPTSGLLLPLENPNDTGIGAAVAPFEFDEDKYRPGPLIRYKELMIKLNDSSLEWTVRRDNETKEPYAFSNTGLWMSYEDRISMEAKVRYVMEKGLAGIGINLLETEDVGNHGEEGRFPLTRAIHNKFNQELMSADATT